MVKRTSLEDDDCPIARSLDAIGDWWSLLIIRDALFGRRRFGEFQKKLGLAKNILTVRLRALVDHGILTTAPASDGSAYQEYVLTPKGRGVFPILVALRQWSEEFDERPEEIATILVDRGKGPAGPQARTALPGRAAARQRYRAEAAAGRATPIKRARREGTLCDLRQLALAAESAAAPPPRVAPSRADGRAPRAGGARASLTNSATVSAMKATASSGPPSPGSFIGWRSPISARSCALPAAVRLAQKICIQIRTILPRNTPLRAQL